MTHTGDNPVGNEDFMSWVMKNIGDKEHQDLST